MALRPEALNGYFRDISALKGVGPRSRSLFEKLVGTRFIDLLKHLPSAMIDRRYRPTVAAATPGSIATLQITVVKHEATKNKRAPHKVICQDDSGFITLVFFHARGDWIRSQLPEGEERLVSGRIEHFSGKAQMTHPDYMVALDKADDLPTIEPIYPMTAGLGAKVIRKAIEDCLSQMTPLPEWINESLLKEKKWPAFTEAVNKAHHPESLDSLMPSDINRCRLAYDELLATQVALAIVREKSRKKRGRSIVGDGSKQKIILDSIGFELTGDQQQTVDDIKADMKSEAAMLRLVQGDVGSGKTIVALLAMTAAVEAGCQAAILAPTEILARQHAQTIIPLADAAGLKVEILTGRNKGKPRDDLLGRLESGDIDILIGTHAIIQDDVVFNDLGFAVIDEQHRFGVHQRMALTSKAIAGVDVLVMTATPIPRTLTLTAYGDMDVSRIIEKPPGRQPIDTRVINVDRIGDVVAGVGRAMASGARVYWVCPLVEESEKLDLAAAEDRFKEMQQVFGDKVGLVHGRMKLKEKDEVMHAFASGEISLLVSTTVIEVGVNVPEATVMVIEQAERFGLAQLHQLRGRVGRGSAKSSCLLLRANHIGEVATSRLKTMRETDDGFQIAEEDLKLRGSGEILGTKQSGVPEFNLVDMIEHADLIETARDDARLFISKDPTLSTERGKAIRHLLYLFERDEGVRLMKSG